MVPESGQVDHTWIPEAQGATGQGLTGAPGAKGIHDGFGMRDPLALGPNDGISEGSPSWCRCAIPRKRAIADESIVGGNAPCGHPGDRQR